MSEDWKIALFGLGCGVIGWVLNMCFTYWKEKKKDEKVANSERRDFENELSALIKGEVRRNFKDNISKGEYDFLIKGFTLRELGQEDPQNHGYRSKKIDTKKYDELLPKINKYNATALEQHNGNEVIRFYEFLEEFSGKDLTYINDISTDKASYYKPVLEYFEFIFR